jgi:hypothetical protein
MDGSHTHDGGGFDPTPVLVVIAGGVALMFVLPVVLAILQVLLWVLIIMAGIAAGGVAAYITYQVKHRHDGVKPAPWQTLPVDRAQPQRALPQPQPGHHVITTEQLQELLRRGYGDA